jgi:hypothetical protein
MTKIGQSGKQENRKKLLGKSAEITKNRNVVAASLRRGVML